MRRVFIPPFQIGDLYSKGFRTMKPCFGEMKNLPPSGLVLWCDRGVSFLSSHIHSSKNKTETCMPKHLSRGHSLSLAIPVSPICLFLCALCTSINMRASSAALFFFVQQLCHTGGARVREGPIAREFS